MKSVFNSKDLYPNPPSILPRKKLPIMINFKKILLFNFMDSDFSLWKNNLERSIPRSVNKPVR